MTARNEIKPTHPVDVALELVGDALAHVDDAPVRCAGALRAMLGECMGSDTFDQSPLLAAFMDATYAAMVQGHGDPSSIAAELLDKCVVQGRGLIESKLCKGYANGFNPAVYLAGLLKVASADFLKNYAVACIEQSHKNQEAKQ